MIIFKKNIKSFCYRPDWSDEPGGIVIEKILNDYDDMVRYLSEKVYVENGVTFEDFFTPVMKNWKQYEVLFSSQLGQNSLKDFYEEWNKPFVQRVDIGINEMFIEVGWGSLELDVNKKKMSHHQYPVFHGVRIPTKEEKKDGFLDSDIMYVGLDFSPLNELKEYKFRVNNIVKVLMWDMKSENEKLTEWGTFEQDLSLYDILGTIFYEITFMGSPEDRNFVRDDLINTAESVRRELDAGNFSDFHEIKIDDDGSVFIDGEKQPTSDEGEIKTPKLSLDDILKKFNIDRPIDGD